VSGRCTTSVEPVREFAGEGSPDTLLGFETTGPLSLRPEWGKPGIGRVVALLWWWGVVFDLWIVVASISQQIAGFRVGGFVVW
jgi:hypothetical protein